MKAGKMILHTICLAAISLVSCQAKLETPWPDSHTVRFVLSPDQTRTSYEVRDDKVVYSWEYTDINRISVFEDGVQGTVNANSSSVTPDNMTLSVTFPGSAEGGHEYRATLNGYVKSSQNCSICKYDSDSDVLVAQPVRTEDGDLAPVQFRFRRTTAIAVLILKGLEDAAGETVSKVVVSSDQPLVGIYTQDPSDDLAGTWAYGPGQDNRIVVECNREIDADGSLPVYIVSRPLENAAIKVSLRTSSGKIYRKTTSPAFSLAPGNVKEQGIRMTKVYEPEALLDGWFVVNGTDELCEGDEIIFACPEYEVAAGTMPDKEHHLTSAPCIFNTDFSQMNAPDGALSFTVGEVFDGWIFSCTDGKLGATSARNLSLSSVDHVWGVEIIDDSKALVKCAAYGSLQYYNTEPRFNVYTSNQKIPRIYKKCGNGTGNLLNPAAVAFNPVAAEVIIDGTGNSFPVLSTDSQGARRWSSSSPEVATVDNTGKITLLSAGTTLISVQIGADATHLPCEAFYELVVRPKGWTGPSGDASAWLELPSGLQGDAYFTDTFFAGSDRNYSYCYEYSTYTSLWVAYPLYKATTGGKRDGDWARNPNLPDNRQINVWSSGYGVNFDTNNPYARGHQIPDADRSGNTTMQHQTYYATNSTPQIQNGFNSGIWSSLEDAVRKVLPERDIVYVATGAVFNTVGGNEPITWIQPSHDSKKAPVPNYYWKALLKVKRDANGNPVSASTIAFWFEHRVYSNDSYLNYAVSVDRIEDLTGLDLFTNLPSSVAAGAETNTDWTTFTNF